MRTSKDSEGVKSPGSTATAAGAGPSSASATPSSPSRSFPYGLCARIFAWCVGWYVCARIEFGAVYLVVSALVAIFRNLSHESKADGSKLSAYSVFNSGAQRIAGSMDAESFEQELRHQPRAKKDLNLDLGDATASKEHYQRKSKAANLPCVCGSGKKYKRCCSLLTANEKELDKEWDEYESEWGARR